MISATCATYLNCEGNMSGRGEGLKRLRMTAHLEELVNIAGTESGHTLSKAGNDSQSP